MATDLEIATVPESDRVIPGPDSWDRQTGESKEKYAWFVLYLELGVMRSSYKLFSCKIIPPSLNVEGYTKPRLTTLRKWEKDFKWEIRADDYDDRNTADALAKYEQNLKQMQVAVKKQEFEYAQRLHSLAEKISNIIDEQGLPKKITTKKTYTEMDNGKVVGRVVETNTVDHQQLVLRLPSLFNAASELMRKAFEMDKKEQESNPDETFDETDLRDVPFEELKALEQRIKKATKGSAIKHIA